MAGAEAPGHRSGRGLKGNAIGAPSAELSLVGLRPRRARLRFTRRQEGNARAAAEQEQPDGQAAKRFRFGRGNGNLLKPGGSVLDEEVVPFWTRISNLRQERFPNAVYILGRQGLAGR